MARVRRGRASRTTACRSSTAAAPIYDLAFVGNETAARARGVSNSWQDRNQADILAGRYSSEHAAATIDFGALDDDATR